MVDDDYDDSEDSDYTDNQRSRRRRDNDKEELSSDGMSHSSESSRSLNESDEDSRQITLRSGAIVCLNIFIFHLCFLLEVCRGLASI